MDAQVRGESSTSLSRQDRRRHAKSCLEAKLQAAYTYIRELEVKCMHAQSEPVDPVVAEVGGRLGLVRPMLCSLVGAEQANSTASISSFANAFCNFGMHAVMGCGVDDLPKDSSEAKRRSRGPRHAPSTAESEFNLRFQQALACCSAFDADSGSDASTGASKSDGNTVSQPLVSCSKSPDQLTFVAGLVADAVGEQLQLHLKFCQ